MKWVYTNAYRNKIILLWISLPKSKLPYQHIIRRYSLIDPHRHNYVAAVFNIACIENGASHVNSFYE